MGKFKLTVAEKRYIREYYRYRAIICSRPMIAEILEAFCWDNETNGRFYAAYRDWSYDDQQCSGRFEQVHNAIKNYLIVLDAKNGNLFYKQPTSA